MILIFNSNSNTDHNFTDYLSSSNMAFINIEQHKIRDWQFRMQQNSKGQFGAVISPKKSIYDLSYVRGIYLLSFCFPNSCAYEFNAWHAMYTWLLDSIPCSITSIPNSKYLNTHKLRYVLKGLGLTYSERITTHYAHCIANTLFLSTANKQMAILQPQIAEKLISSLRTMGLNQGQFYLNYSNDQWSCLQLDFNPDWEQCAFPESFIYSAMLKFLSNPGNCNNWQQSHPFFSATCQKKEGNFISQKFLPEVAGSNYYPAP